MKLKFTRKMTYHTVVSAGLVSALLTGCNTPSAIPPSSPNSSASGGTSPSTNSTNSTGTGLGAGVGTGNTPVSTPSTNASTSSSGSSSAGSSTASIPSSPTNSQGSVTVVAEPAQMILYAPMVWALNTVHVTGNLSNGTTTAVTVEAVTANGGVVASDRVNTTSNGSFAANLYLPDNGPANMAFKAYGGGTAASTGVFYFNAIPLVQGTPAVFSEVHVRAQQMGTDFPVWTPTWLPQSITSTPQSQPAYSANLAAKSFTYTADIFATPRAYPINDSALNTPTPIEIAQIGGQSFASAKAAEQQMMYGLQQTFAQTLPSGTLSLGNLSGVTYTTPTPAILWHEGKWTLVVQGPVPQVNRTEAQAIVRILNQVYLPPTNGLVFVQNTTSVNNTQSAVTEVSFIQGSDLYTVSTQTGQIYNALVMAASSHRDISGVHGIS